MSSLFLTAGFTEELKVARFLSRLYERLGDCGPKTVQTGKLSVIEEYLGSQLMHRIAEALLAQVDNNGNPCRDPEVDLAVGRYAA